MRRLFWLIMTLALVSCSDDPGFVDDTAPRPEGIDIRFDVEPVDADRMLLASLVDGYWVEYQIGNATDIATWLRFEQDGHLERTLVTYVIGELSGVGQSLGSFQLDRGSDITLRWDTGESSHVHQFTAAIVPFSNQEWYLPPPFAPTPWGLNTMAFARNPEQPSQWERRYQRVIAADGATYRYQTADISLTVDPAIPVALEAPLTCEMVVTIDVATGESEATVESATEQFQLPCTMTVQTNGTIQVAADGFGGSRWDGSWGDYLEEAGLYERYGVDLAYHLEQVFRPVLTLNPEVPDRLYHDMSWAWFANTTTPPPGERN